MKKPLIIFQNFSFQYYNQNKNTLKKLNITIYEGEKVLIVGKSGSGKSTFLKCINGLIPHSYPGKITGSAIIQNKNLAKTNIFDLSLNIGTIMQDADNQFVGLTVAEDIAFALENDNLSHQKIVQKVNQWADKLNLQPFLHHQIQDLSEGEKKLVAMAGVLIYNPSILLFDESLTNLDATGRKKIIDLIEKLHQKNKNTILMIEHYLDDILTDSFDRVIVFDDGKIIADMTAEQIIEKQILIQQGIQEPFYIKILRNSKIDLTKINFLCNLNKINIASFSEELINSSKTKLNIPLSFLDNKKKLLELKNIFYQSTEKKDNLLNDISLTLWTGQMISIVGPNGCGKSLLGKMIAGLLKPHKGQVSLKDKKIAIGFVSQNPDHMLFQNTVFEEIALGLRLQKLSSKEIDQQVKTILDICGLTPFAFFPITTLSFGQKKRVAIAAILVLKPEIIILDEPTAGQDFYHYTKIMAYLKKLSKEGATVIIITHDISLILEYTQTTLVLNKGKMIVSINPISLLTDNLLIKKSNLKDHAFLFFLNKLQMQPQTKTNFMKYIKEHCFK
ncbi:ABC transporter ATP-binding protein [Candidatus Phytoplasma australiense]|nr:ABC transporter ATP-binding protein [Candidatus Phytoplasma australiense]